MKQITILAIIAMAAALKAQNLKPDAISAAYFGEMATHPGLRVGAIYHLHEWEKHKTRKNGNEKHLQKSLDFMPSIGVFYHKNYQTSVFALTEVILSRKKSNGNFRSIGFGAGYMRTFLPNVYEFDENDDLKRIHAGHNYFLMDYNMVFGKDLMVKKSIPLDIYVKPHFMYAMPNTSKGIWYFALELGVNYKLASN